MPPSSAGSLPEPDFSSAPLQEWYGHLFWAFRQKCLLFTSAPTLYSVLIPGVRAAASRKSTPELLRAALRESLHLEGAPAPRIAALESLLAGDLLITPTRDRRVLGSMNELIRLLHARFEEYPALPPPSELPAMNAWLNKTPMGLLKYEFPTDLFHQTLEKL